MIYALVLISWVIVFYLGYHAGVTYMGRINQATYEVTTELINFICTELPLDTNQMRALLRKWADHKIKELRDGTLQSKA